MIRITITEEARDAIARTIAEGAALYGPQEPQDGRLWVWLPKGVARALATLRRPGESYSDTIIRIANGGR